MPHKDYPPATRPQHVEPLLS